MPHEPASDRIHDEVAPSYTTTVDHTTSQRLKIELPDTLAAPDAAILDVGCGNGLHLSALSAHRRRLVGVDRSAGMLEHVVDGHRLELARGDAEHLPFRDATFDLVYSFSMLVIVADPLAVLAEMARVTRVGGMVIVDIAGRFNLSIHAWRWWYRKRGQTWLHAFDVDGADRALRSVGLTPVTWHASGFADQWKYVPLVRRLRGIDRIVHEGSERDRDYRLSNARGLFRLANRWYVVATRTS